MTVAGPLGAGKKLRRPPDGGDLLSSAWRWEIVGVSLGSLAGLRCFWRFRCVGELEVIST